MKFNSTSEEQIYAILLNEWDPIGIKDIVEAQDEYVVYLPMVVKLLLDQKYEYLVTYLSEVETERMGFSEADKEKINKAVKLLGNIQMLPTKNLGT